MYTEGSTVRVKNTLDVRETKSTHECLSVQTMVYNINNKTVRVML